MNKVCKKSLLSLLLALVLAIGMLPITAFAAETHTVYFETDSPTAIRPVTVDSGSRLSQPTTPRKSGYVFVGWYKDTALTDRWNFSRDTVTRNMTLYARWEDRDDYYGYGYGYSRNPYSYGYDDDYYYYGSYGYRIYDEEYDRYLYTNDYYWDRDDDGYYYYNRSSYRNTRDRDRIDVEGGADQVYTGSNEISFTVYGASNVSMMSMVIYPDGDRNKEVILTKGTDYTVKSSTSSYGTTVTLKYNILDSLKNGRYQVRMYFVNEQANASFTVKY